MSMRTAYTPIILTDDLVGRFWSKVNRTETCWLWTRAADRRGYGRIGIGAPDKRLLGTHRLAYAIYFGDPADQMVLHRCDNPRCVRPEHLFLGTQLDNIRDMDAKGRRISKPKVERCAHGHEMSGDNVLVSYARSSSGERACRECSRVRSREFARKRRAEHGDEVRAYKRRLARQKRDRENVPTAH